MLDATLFLADSPFAALAEHVVLEITERISLDVENPTVDQTGKSGDTKCVTDCDDTNTTCVAKCSDDGCKASCKTDLDTCTSMCTTTTSGGAGA